MVMMDMRYMWSEMDSPDSILLRRQPSRLVVLRRSRRCRKGREEVGWGVVGGALGMCARAGGGGVSVGFGCVFVEVRGRG